MVFDRACVISTYKPVESALSKAGILEQRRDGRRMYFKADKTSPVFADSKNLLEKTAGIVPVLEQEPAPLQDRIRLAFVYGSVARSQEESGSDIDLMVVGMLVCPIWYRRCETRSETLAAP